MAQHIPFVWWLPAVIGTIGAFFYQAILEGDGAEHACARKLRWHFLIYGLIAIYVGGLMMYFAPTGWRFHTPLHARLFGVLIMAAGIVCFAMSFSREKELRAAFAGESSARRLDAGARGITPRDRVMGFESEKSRTDQ